MLIRSALAGEQNSYERLMKKYYNLIQSLVYKMIFNKEDVEDLTQEAFIKAFNSLHKFNREFAFSTWLYKIATNNCIDYLRKKKLTTFSIDKEISSEDDDLRFEIPDEEHKPDKRVMNEQRKKIIEQAIDSLPVKYKRVIILRHKEEKDYEEIAEELNIPLGTVKAHLFRARELLNKILKDKIGHY
ncbi:MAG: sigma-70 family RNA polymerase sigma factor [Ignavibacteria bacterium]|nr:sigma-70 family RNA polymerase sigma factor [Ignavibacteria bacterium]